MTRKFIISTAAAALVALGSLPASANSVWLDQYGFGNEAGGVQTGNGNAIGVYQNGIFNGAIAKQYACLQSVEQCLCHVIPAVRIRASRRCRRA